MHEHKPFFLRNDIIKLNCAQYINNLQTDSDRPWVVEIKSMKRTLEQSAMFHAICGDIARQHKFMGRMLTPAQWKVLLISGHKIATGEGADMVPGLQGEFVNIRESSAQMSVKRLASLITYAQAYCADNGIALGDER